MPKPAVEKPVDPLVRARTREGDAKTMPALIPQPVRAGHNSGNLLAGKILVSGLDRIRHLEREIGTLNSAKSDVYAELRSQGYDMKTIKRIQKEEKLDPLVREEQDEFFRVYWSAVQAVRQTDDEAGGAGEAG